MGQRPMMSSALEYHPFRASDGGVTPLVPGPKWFQPYLDAMADSTTILVFLAPAVLFGQLWWNQETLKMPPLVLLGQCCNTYNWILYGLRIESSAVVYPNIVGLLSAVCYGLLYPFFCDSYYWDSDSTGAQEPVLNTTAEVQAGKRGFRHNFRLQYLLEVAMVAGVWTAPWALRMSTDTIGWFAVGLDCIFLTAPLWVIFEVIYDWRADNVQLLGSLSMNFLAFVMCFAWVLQYLMYLPEFQMLPSNALGLAAEVVTLGVRFLKPRERIGVILRTGGASDSSHNPGEMEGVSNFARGGERAGVALSDAGPQAKDTNAKSLMYSTVSTSDGSVNTPLTESLLPAVEEVQA